jgi:hypothetical protein
MTTTPARWGTAHVNRAGTVYLSRYTPGLNGPDRRDRSTIGGRVWRVGRTWWSHVGGPTPDLAHKTRADAITTIIALWNAGENGM